MTEQEFAALMKQHNTHVFRFVRRMVGDEAVAEDITQDAFIKAWNSINSFDPEKKFSTWIFQIAKNTAVDVMRKKKIPAISAIQHADYDGEIIDTVADVTPLPPQVLASAEQAHEVRQALESLAPHEAQIIQLHLEEDMTFADIADLLEEPIDTIKSRYRRTLLKLRAKFAPK